MTTGIKKEGRWTGDCFCRVEGGISPPFGRRNDNFIQGISPRIRGRPSGRNDNEEG
ncbi:MAG: hypothetical protein ACYC6P_14150 [Ignavibacteriaceae bacterium]